MSSTLPLRRRGPRPRLLQFKKGDKVFALTPGFFNNTPDGASRLLLHKLWGEGGRLAVSLTQRRVHFAPPPSPSALPQAPLPLRSAPSFLQLCRAPQISAHTHPAGCYAEYVVAEEGWLAKVPDNLPLEQAAGVPLVALTAWQALQQAKPQAGQRALVNAAAGGVGHMAVQLAKALGLHVVGICGPKNLEWVKQLGADEVRGSGPR